MGSSQDEWQERERQVMEGHRLGTEVQAMVDRYCEISLATNTVDVCEVVEDLLRVLHGDNNG